MAKIPESALGDEFPLPTLRRGKVRDTYELPEDPGKLLLVASDRVSIFDFVLPCLVPGKGEVLNALNVFWRRRLAGHLAHDLVAYGDRIDGFLPEPLRGDPGLQSRAAVVERLEMLPVEAVMRGYLTGSAWKAYKRGEPYCGHVFSPGLLEGNRLPLAIFTPTTKAEDGHDEPVDADVADAQSPGVARLAANLYAMGVAQASACGLLLADSKFEFGYRPDGIALVLADEVFTPDSSRFWDADAWSATQPHGLMPPPFDKQLVRNWGKTLGIDKRDPKNPDDVAWVHAQTVPNELLAQTAGLYQDLFQRLTGCTLERYQRDHLGIVR